MTFAEKAKLSNEYRVWLEEENSKNDFLILPIPETFLAFLEIKGYKIIKDKQREVKRMNERNCENCKHHTENGCTSWECEYEPEDENTAK